MLKCGLVLFVMAFAITNASFNYSSTETELGVCVSKILSRIAESRTFTSDVSLVHCKDTVAQTLHGIKRTRFITRTLSWENEQVHSTIYVMHFYNFIEMKKTFDVLVQDTYWTPHSNFIISMVLLEDNLVKITDYLVFNNIYNVTFVSKKVNDYMMFTFHSPIRPCKRLPRLLHVAQCSEYDGGSHIFPVTTIKELRGCRFKLAAHNVYPMVNMDDDGLEGYEQQMVNIFSKRHHFVMELVEMYKIDKFEIVVATYPSKDMLGMVSAGHVEGVVGGYFLDYRLMGQYFFTYPVVIDHMVQVMPRADVYNAWLALYYKAFNASISVLGLIVIFSILAHLLALFPSREKDPLRDFIIIFGFFLNKITIREIKKGISETLITSSLLFSVFILPYMMQAFLNSVKTHPIRGFEVKAASEIDENYRLILPRIWRNTKLDFNNNSQTQTCENIIDCISQVTLSKDRKRYTLMSDMTYKMYKWMPKHAQCDSETYQLREPVYSLLRTLYFRPGSVLVHHFDKFLFHYVAGGLEKKQLSDIIFKARLQCRELVKPAYEPLQLKDVRPAFVILIGGSSLSFICFAFEIMANKMLCI